MIKRIFGMLFIVLVHGLELFSQSDDLNFFPLNRYDGLSDENITDIVKDHNGYLWFGTENGLNRFDGNEFTVFKQLSDSKSLPGNAIADLLVTRDGELWVGIAHQGICQYITSDHSFETVYLSDLPGIHESSLFVGFAEDSKSNLYVITTHEVYIRPYGESKFQNITEEIINVDPEIGKNLQDEEIFAITHDETEGIWLALSGNNLIFYEYNENTILYDLKLENPAVRTVVHTMISHLGKIWIGGMGPQFCVYDPEKMQSEILLSNENLILVYQINVSSDNSMWLSAAGSLIHYYPESGNYNRYSGDDSKLRSLTSTPSSCFYEDEAGIYWIGLYNSGINYAFKNLPFRHISVGEGFMNLSDRYVTALLNDKKGGFWIGLESGAVEHHFPDGTGKDIIPIEPLEDQASAGVIFTLYEDSKGDIYCTSWRGGIQKYHPARKCFVPLFGSSSAYFEHIDGIDIRDVLEDTNGRLWMTVHGKGVYAVDVDKQSVEKFKSSEDSASITLDWVFNLELDDEGFVWVSSAWGLSKININDGSVRRYIDLNQSLGLSDNAHKLITKDKEGNIWVGTDHGINLYHRASDRFFSYTTDDGLPYDLVRGFIQDEDGTYWMSTAYGIVSFKLMQSRSDRPILESVNSYDIHDGLIQDNFALNCYCEGNSGGLYFGGLMGVDYFIPQDVHPFFTAPNLLISSIKVFAEEIYPGTSNGPIINENGEIVLDFRQNNLSIDFIAMNYFDANKNNYSYKLEPFSSEYIELGNENNLIFSQLSPGHYSLSLLVLTENGFIQESSDILKVYIVPPFWMTSWFKYILIILLILIAGISVRLYTSSLRKRKHELEEDVRQRTLDLENSNALKDKLFSIIAHDLKNPFNIISGFSDLLYDQFDSYSDDKKKELLQNIRESTSVAYTLLENLLHWSRSQSGSLKINLQDILVSDLFENLEQLFKTSMLQKKLQLSLSVENTLLVRADKNLLNVVLRNLISNAFKFTAQGGHILVTARISNNQRDVQFEVTDTGQGIDREDLEKIFRINELVSKRGTEGESGTGLGMLLCEEFVSKMHGNISIESEVEKGTKVIFTLPQP